MEFSWLICLWAIQGAIASYIAQKKGRNPFLWFAIGSFFGLFGILAVFFVKPVKKEPVVLPPQPTLPHRMWYYLDAQSQQFGPLSTHALRSAFGDGKLSPSSYVWHEGMQQWESFEKVCRDSGISTDSLAT